ncbi:MAG: ATP-binding cassette domain-containing protein, partial [Microvirgula sp.]
MPRIVARNIVKIFGHDSERALAMLRQGADKAGVLAATGCTVGLDDVSLEIDAGQVFVIMGLSGSGKSTL